MLLFHGYVAVSKHLLKSFSSSCVPFGPSVRYFNISLQIRSSEELLPFFSSEIVSEISLHVNGLLSSFV